MRTFEFSDATSHKFWNIEIKDTYYQVKFGKIGSAGQTQRKTFATAAEAHRNLMLTKALDLSAKRKAPVKLPLEPEEERKAA